MQEVPVGQRIVGFSCSVGEDRLYHVSFLLAKKDEKEIIGHLSFPLLDSYPTREEFDSLYLPEGQASTELSDFRLSTITYTQYQASLDF